MVSPVVIFTYNRVVHTRELIASLEQNYMCSETDVYIFSDGFKCEKDKVGVLEVRKFLTELRETSKFKNLKIVESEANRGLAASIIDGVTKVIDKYGKAIVLEDDLVLARGFLKYMNMALDTYKDESKVWSISGFSSDIDYLHEFDKDVFFSCRARSWGWATWKDRWDSVDWTVQDYDQFKYNLSERKKFNRGGSDMAAMLDRQQVGDVNSWAIRFCFNQFKQNRYTVQPTISLVSNQGQDGSGTNCKSVREVNDVSDSKEGWDLIPFEYNAEIDKQLAKRKKVAKYKLIGNYFVNVLLRSNIKKLTK